MNALLTGLRCSELACGYPRANRRVLEGIHASFPRGGFVCVIGPNGSGKTTLLRTLAGLIPAVDGTVELDGANVHTIPAGDRARRISVVLTQLGSPGYLTVRRFVELGRHPYTGLLGRRSRDDDEAVDEALDRTGIVSLANRWMAEISDGERQRAAVARALAQAADVMILDEPTAFLDVAARASVMTTLRTIAHDTGRLIVSSSHDIEMVLRTADQVVLIAEGGSLRSGCPEDLVLDGAITSLFPGNSLRFDDESGTYRLPEPSGAPIAIEGEGRRRDWVAHAMERIGRRVTNTDGAEVTITIGEGDYRLQTRDQEHTYPTILSLTEAVRHTHVEGDE